MTAPATAVLDAPAVPAVVVPPVPPVVPPPAAVVAPVVPAVPDTYDLKAPDGVDAGFVERTAATARELGLTHDAAQKLLDRDVATAKAGADERAALIAAWSPGGEQWLKRDAEWRAAAEAKAGSPEKLGVLVEHAQQALAKWGTPALREELQATGYGSHPEVLTMLAKIGAASAESTMVVGASAGRAEAPKTAAEVMYPGDGRGPKPGQR